MFGKERRFRENLAGVYKEGLTRLESLDERPETKTLLGSAMAGAQNALRCFARAARTKLRSDERLDNFRVSLIQEAKREDIRAAFRVTTFAYVRRFSAAPWPWRWAGAFPRASEVLEARPGPEQRVLALTPPEMAVSPPDRLDPSFAEFQAATAGAVIEAVTGQTVEVGLDELGAEWSDCFTNGLPVASAFLESAGPRLGADMSALRG